ncbi:MAG: hypothetical protein ACRDIB_19800, partial [Ardenticatenaceae bacterium]
MTLGQLNPLARLGIANCTEPNARSFANTVLWLPSDIPIYQQQLVRHNGLGGGPPKEWAWCGAAPDDDRATTTVLRSISAHDFRFGRRNIQDRASIDRDNFLQHIA